MYLVNDIDCVIKLIWIYNHEQFAKRPGDKYLGKINCAFVIARVTT